MVCDSALLSQENIQFKMDNSSPNDFKTETLYAHLDSTSFHLHREYNNIETAENYQERPILITKGYSRDYRPDLKQCVLDLIFL